MRFFWFLCATILTNGIGAASAQSTPDPLALLRGVASARESVRSGYIEVDYSKIPTKGEREDGKLTFEFDGDKRTTMQSAGVFFVKSGDERKSEAAGSRAEAEKRGLGKTVATRISFGWDGKKLTNYWSASVQANYRNPAVQMPDYYFDPRVLGIDLNNMFSSTIERSSGLEEPRAVDLVGEERVGDRKAWRIKVVSRHGDEFHFWVEGQSPFRVLRKKHADEYGSEVLESQYELSSDSPLPKATIYKRYSKTNELFLTVTMKVTKAELNRPVSDKVGTLASLEVPAGTEVYDDVEHKLLGYWNGTEISDTRDLAVQQSIEAITGEPQVRHSNLWYWIGGAVAAVLLLAFWRFRSRREA